MKKNGTESKWIPVWATVLILLTSLLIYRHAIDGIFIWDDHILVKDNVSIRSLSFLPRIFLEEFGEGAGVRYGFYRPLQIAVYAAGYALWGLDPAAYHIVNIVLHILVGLCVYRLVYLLWGDSLCALISSVLFVIHPVHTETVAFISNLGELLSALFVLLGFIFYKQWVSGRSRIQYLLFLTSFLLALLSKESAVILPLFLFAYHYSINKKIEILPALSLIGIVIIYVVFRSAVVDSTLPVVAEDPPARLAGFFVAMANYLRLLFFPVDLHMEYGQPVFRWFSVPVLLSIGLVAVVWVLAFRSRKKNPVITFSIAWFFTGLLPFNNILTLPFYMAEHYVYIPSLGFFIVLGHLFSKGIRSFRLRPYVILILGLLVGLHMYLTCKQTDYWQRPIPFNKRTLKYEPHQSHLYHNLGDAYLETGDYTNAVLSYQRAIELAPHKAGSYKNMALAYIKIGAIEQAMAAHQKAITLNPNDGEAHNNFGALLYNLGDVEEAVEHYHKAIELNPRYYRAYVNLGLASFHSGDPDEAIKHYRQALAINPDYAEAYNNLGVVYTALDKPAEALRWYKKVLAVNPQYIDAYYNMGIVYHALGKIPEAFEMFSTVITLDPAHVDALYNLGVLYMKSGWSHEAETAFKRVLEIQPQGDAYYRLALICFERGDMASAIDYYDTAIQYGVVDPKLADDLEPHRK